MTRQRQQPSTVKRSALLTVGSTQFDDLVKAALQPDCLEALAEHGVSKLVVQFGTGKIVHILRYVALEVEAEGGLPQSGRDAPVHVQTGEGVEVELHAFMNDIEERMANVDLVISHAGAGSILAALRGPALSRASKNPPQLIIVPNDRLMDAHQSELAVEFGKHGWAQVSSPSTLADTVRSLSTRAVTNPQAGAVPVKFPPFDPSKMQSIINEQMGFA